MALLLPVPGSTQTQKYGESHLGVEPAMYANSERAYWQPYTGLKFYNDFHAALDLAAMQGTPILASEAGRVIESYFDATNGGGHKVTVEIRPNVRYTNNHMHTRHVAVGAHVARGQTIGTVGATGLASGNHDHFQVTIREVDGAVRTFLYNPTLFLPGGSKANDARIKPLTVQPPATQYVQINGPGINIRTSADLDAGSTNIYATSQNNGIIRAGKVIAPLDVKMKFGGWVVNDDGTWAQMWLANAYRFCKKELTHFA